MSNMEYDDATAFDAGALQQALDGNCKHHTVYAPRNLYNDATQLAEKGVAWLDEYDAIVLEGVDRDSILLAQVAGNEIKIEYDPSPLSQFAAIARHPLKTLYGDDGDADGVLEYTPWTRGCILERRDGD